MAKKVIVLAWLCMAFASCAHAGNSLGTYIECDQNSAFIMQLTKTTDHHFKGHYEQTVLRNDGTIQYMKGLAGGEIRGRAMVAFLSGPLAGTLAGETSGNSLRLSGGGNAGPLSLNLLRGNERDFQAAVATFQATAATLSALSNAAQSLHRSATQTKKITSLMKNELLQALREPACNRPVHK